MGLELYMIYFVCCSNSNALVNHEQQKEVIADQTIIKDDNAIPGNSNSNRYESYRLYIIYENN